MAKTSGKSSLILILLLAGALLVVKGFRSCRSKLPQTKEQQVEQQQNSRSLWRTKKLVYTKHARCRMDCRAISENEVEEIQHNGKVNYLKSDLQDKPCASYAVEGLTPDGQQVRIVFGACEKITTVITCIDLEQEHACNCN